MSMHAISSYCGNRPTNKHTQTGPITIHCTAKLSTQCNYLLSAVLHQSWQKWLKINRKNMRSFRSIFTGWQPCGMHIGDLCIYSRVLASEGWRGLATLPKVQPGALNGKDTPTENLSTNRPAGSNALDTHLNNVIYHIWGRVQICWSSKQYSVPQIQLWCWQCAPYKCLYYYYY